MSIANPPAMRESQLQSAIIEAAQRLGFRVMHQQAAMRRDGSWVTAIAGSPGWPDLVLLRPPRLIVAELKSVKGVLSQEQALWLNGLKLVAGVEAYLWRPGDWTSGRIEEVLR